MDFSPNDLYGQPSGNYLANDLAFDVFPGNQLADVDIYPNAPSPLLPGRRLHRIAPSPSPAPRAGPSNAVPLFLPSPSPVALDAFPNDVFRSWAPTPRPVSEGRAVSRRRGTPMVPMVAPQEFVQGSTSASDQERVRMERVREFEEVSRIKAQGQFRFSAKQYFLTYAQVSTY